MSDTLPPTPWTAFSAKKITCIIASLSSCLLDLFPEYVMLNVSVHTWSCFSYSKSQRCYSGRGGRCWRGRCA